MDETKKFQAEVRENVARLGQSQDLLSLGLDFVGRTAPFRYSYNFSWLGRPIIQLPQDMIAMQEIIWRVRPDLVIETGIAHGGSLVFYASLLELLGRGRVLGIDVDIREHNRRAIEAHPMAARIDMIQGSSLDPELYAEVRARAAKAEVVLVTLDSNHTHEHVLEELRRYAPLVTPGSYCVVFDTVIEDMPAEFVSRSTLGNRQQPEDGGARVPEDDGRIRDRRVDPAQTADHRRARRVPAPKDRVEERCGCRRACWETPWRG